MNLPDWDNAPANAILVALLNREREQELTKLDYITYSLLAVTGAQNEKTFKAKMNMITGFRKAAAEVLYGDAYDPIIQQRKIRQIKEAKQEDSKLLAKLKTLK